MTPTEQEDKELRDRVVAAVADAHLRALQEKHPIDTVETLGPVASDTATQLVDQLITADRKRVALEAKINGILFAKNHFQDFCNEEEHEAINQRIAELKAQQEEV